MSDRKTLIQKLRVRQNGKCCYCGRQMAKWKHKDGERMPDNAETFEHLTKYAHGGSVTSDNAALACSECNTGRGCVDWLTYKTYKMGEFFSEEIA